jgi:predicted nucleic acid-binding protein
MNRVFADAFYFIAILNEHDQDHDRVLEIASLLRVPFVTTEYILVEVADALSGMRHRSSFTEFVRRLQNSPKVDLIPAGAALFEAGLNLYNARPDKQWSLTDCNSFEVMPQRHLTEALTADHHFKQAGFRVLL